MVEGFITGQKEGLNFREIVLAHLKKILEITSMEFRGGFWHDVGSGNVTKHEYVGDTRKMYIQTIQSLYDVLLPYFDKEMIEFIEKFEKKMEELKKKLEKDYETLEEDERKKVTTSWSAYYSHHQLPEYRILFQQLNLLLKRVDYLKKSIYSEEVEEPIEVDTT